MHCIISNINLLNRASLSPRLTVLYYLPVILIVFVMFVWNIFLFGGYNFLRHGGYLSTVINWSKNQLWIVGFDYFPRSRMRFYSETFDRRVFLYRGIARNLKNIVSSKIDSVDNLFWLRTVKSDSRFFFQNIRLYFEKLLTMLIINQKSIVSTLVIVFHSILVKNLLNIAFRI